MNQFKTLVDLREIIKGVGKYYARPIVRGEHPTLHLTSSSSSRQLINGIQRHDYLFSECLQWVLPSENHGLSFSSHWQHIKGIHRMKSKRNLGKPVDVYWVLEAADIPSGMAFVVDPDDRKKQHYFLSVTERMHVDQLRAKLEWVADRMSVINDAQGAL